MCFIGNPTVASSFPGLSGSSKAAVWVNPANGRAVPFSSCFLEVQLQLTSCETLSFGISVFPVLILCHMVLPTEELAAPKPPVPALLSGTCKAGD